MYKVININCLFSYEHSYKDFFENCHIEVIAHEN